MLGPVTVTCRSTKARAHALSGFPPTCSDCWVRPTPYPAYLVLNYLAFMVVVCIERQAPHLNCTLFYIENTHHPFQHTSFWAACKRCWFCGPSRVIFYDGSIYWPKRFIDNNSCCLTKR